MQHLLREHVHTASQDSTKENTDDSHDPRDPCLAHRGSGCGPRPDAGSQHAGRARYALDAGRDPDQGQPKSPSNATAAEAAAKSSLEGKGYVGVKSLTRDTSGNWAAKAMRNGVEVAVVLQPDGTVREQ